MSRVDTIKRQKLNQRLLTNSFPQELIPQVVDIPDYVEVIEKQEILQAAEKEVDVKIKALGEIPVPLTEAQAEVVDQRIQASLANINVARKALSDLRLELDKKIREQDSESISFAIDLKGKPRLGRAIKKLWGEKRQSFTFDMYKELLEAKKKLESDEINKFTNGRIKK